MKVAISTDDGKVSAHFGRCPSFTLVEIMDGLVIEKKEIANPGHHPGFLPEFLKENGANMIVAGGMGMKARDLFAEADIEVKLGISGDINEIIYKIQEGYLVGGESTCTPHSGKEYGIDKSVCDHEEQHDH